VATGFPEVVSTVFQSMAALPGIIAGRKNGKSDFV